ncbi:MAG: MFS transporter [Liquorilactobacillus ghanensis]|uniref:MFS transporter n=1 Tax=Liquorilactobacillus ghanensis TaxID=399370 RepID=UPI0039E9BC01
MKKRQFMILATMAIGIFLCMLDTTVMNIALPAIQTGLRTNLDTLQWALNIYTITFAALTIPLGRLADHVGRNKVYLIGLILFLIGSLISASSTTVTMLIAGREIQSVGAAIVFPASMTIGINSIELSKRNQAIAVLGTTQGLAAAFGPTIGGLVTQFFGWQGIFYINAPLILIAIGLCVILLPLKNEPTVHAKLDLLGMFLAVITLFSLVLALVKGSDWGWTSSRVIYLLLIFILSFGLFIWRESIAPDPMIRLELFKYRDFTGSVIVTVLSGMFFVGMMVLMPSFFTNVQGHTELEAALMITPASVMLFLFSPVSSFLLNKISSRTLIASGIVLLALGYTGLSIMNPDIYWQFTISCILIGTGYGTIIGPLTVLSADDFTGELLTASQSVTGVFRQIGTVLAVAVFVSSFSSNLKIAQNQVWSTAQIKVKKIDSSQIIKNKILRTTHRNLFVTENSKLSSEPVINYKTQSNIIKNKTHQYLENHNGSQLPLATKKKIQFQIANIVKNKVNKINLQVKNYQQEISTIVKQKMTTAFIKPYQVATPFVWLLLCTTFIFEKRKN